MPLRLREQKLTVTDYLSLQVSLLREQPLMPVMKSKRLQCKINLMQFLTYIPMMRCYHVLVNMLSSASYKAPGFH